MISEKRSAKEEIKQDGLKEGYADVNWVARKGGFFFFSWDCPMSIEIWIP